MDGGLLKTFLLLILATSGLRLSTRQVLTGTTGPPNTIVEIFWKRGNNYNFDVDVEVTDSPETNVHVLFWAHQFGFVNGSRGYIGLQVVGSQKKASFSIWGAITGEPGYVIEEGGLVWSIVVDYDWKLGQKYRLRIWELEVEENGDEWWLGTVYDYASGIDTVIGKILVPASWGWLASYSVTWTEYAGYDNYNSSDIPYTRAIFSNHYARHSAENSGPDKLRVAYGTLHSLNSDVDYYGDMMYALEAGNDVVRNTPEGWLTEHEVNETWQNGNLTSIQVAEKAALWVISQAVSEAGGFKWSFVSSYGRTLYSPDFGSGAAGIGTFMLLLFNRTQEVIWLDSAKGAADWIISVAVPSDGGFKWGHPDDDIPVPGWFLSSQDGGASGIGEFLLKMYRIAGNYTYLAYAEGAARWMMAHAISESGGAYIPYNPDRQAAHGVQPHREAATAIFFLHLYSETHNLIYLNAVKDTANWLTSRAISENGGYKWVNNYPYVNDFPISGNGGIALFFYELYETLHDATYLQYANGAIRWILNQAIVEQRTAKWSSVQGGTKYYLAEGFQYPLGINTIAEVFLRAYSITSDEEYLEWARKQVNWMIGLAVPNDNGYKFPYEEGEATFDPLNNARVFKFLRTMYEITGNSTYAEYADGVFSWITNEANLDNDGYKWLTGDEFRTVFAGTSGLGFCLLISPTAKPLQALQLVLGTNVQRFDYDKEFKVTCYLFNPSNSPANAEVSIDTPTGFDVLQGDTKWTAKIDSSGSVSRHLTLSAKEIGRFRVNVSVAYSIGLEERRETSRSLKLVVLPRVVAGFPASYTLLRQGKQEMLVVYIRNLMDKDTAVEVKLSTDPAGLIEFENESRNETLGAYEERTISFRITPLQVSVEKVLLRASILFESYEVGGTSCRIDIKEWTLWEKLNFFWKENPFFSFICGVIITVILREVLVRLLKRYFRSN